jgi:hypothetical protein
MDWNEIQNFSSNIVFGILLFAMITIGLIYHCLMILILSKIGRFSTILLMEFYFLFFVLVGL